MARDEMPSPPHQAVTPVHERMVEAGESVHITHMIVTRTVTLSIVTDVNVQEGNATQVINKDVHPPTPDMSVPPASPPDDMPMP